MVSETEKIFKALGDKSRLRIINILSQRSLCVCEITKVLKLSQSTVSGHLRILKDTGIVEDKKDGLWVEYRLGKRNPFILSVLALTIDALKAHRKMAEERKATLTANREELCKK